MSSSVLLAFVAIAAHGNSSITDNVVLDAGENSERDLKISIYNCERKRKVSSELLIIVATLENSECCKSEHCLMG